MQADCTHLPLPPASIDVTLADLPFGKRHKTQMGIKQLYTLTLAEICRVTRSGGVVVALTTKKTVLSSVVEADDRWLPVSRHEVYLGGLVTYALVARRR